jgi:hypothetical protein
MVNVTVEIGFDLGDQTPVGFKLDDPVKGVLDNTEYILRELFSTTSPTAYKAFQQEEERAKP